MAEEDGQYGAKVSQASLPPFSSFTPSVGLVPGDVGYRGGGNLQQHDLYGSVAQQAAVTGFQPPGVQSVSQSSGFHSPLSVPSHYQPPVPVNEAAGLSQRPGQLYQEYGGTPALNYNNNNNNGSSLDQSIVHTTGNSSTSFPQQSAVPRASSSVSHAFPYSHHPHPNMLTTQPRFFPHSHRVPASSQQSLLHSEQMMMPNSVNPLPYQIPPNQIEPPYLSTAHQHHHPPPTPRHHFPLSTPPQTQHKFAGAHHHSSEMPAETQQQQHQQQQQQQSRLPPFSLFSAQHVSDNHEQQAYSVPSNINMNPSYPSLGSNGHNPHSIQDHSPSLGASFTYNSYPPHQSHVPHWCSQDNITQLYDQSSKAYRSNVHLGVSQQAQVGQQQYSFQTGLPSPHTNFSQEFQSTSCVPKSKAGPVAQVLVPVKEKKENKKAAPKKKVKSKKNQNLPDVSLQVDCGGTTEENRPQSSSPNPCFSPTFLASLSSKRAPEPPISHPILPSAPVSSSSPQQTAAPPVLLKSDHLKPSVPLSNASSISAENNSNSLDRTAAGVNLTKCPADDDKSFRPVTGSSNVPAQSEQTSSSEAGKCNPGLVLNISQREESVSPFQLSPTFLASLSAKRTDDVQDTGQVPTSAAQLSDVAQTLSWKHPLGCDTNVGAAESPAVPSLCQFPGVPASGSDHLRVSVQSLDKENEVVFRDKSPSPNPISPRFLASLSAKKVPSVVTSQCHTQSIPGSTVPPCPSKQLKSKETTSVATSEATIVFQLNSPKPYVSPPSHLQGPEFQYPTPPMEDDEAKDQFPVSDSFSALSPYPVQKVHQSSKEEVKSSMLSIEETYSLPTPPSSAGPKFANPMEIALSKDAQTNRILEIIAREKEKAANTPLTPAVEPKKKKKKKKSKAQGDEDRGIFIPEGTGSGDCQVPHGLVNGSSLVQSDPLCPGGQPVGNVGTTPAGNMNRPTEFHQSAANCAPYLSQNFPPPVIKQLDKAPEHNLSTSSSTKNPDHFIPFDNHPDQNLKSTQYLLSPPTTNRDNAPLQQCSEMPGFVPPPNSINHVGDVHGHTFPQKVSPIMQARHLNSSKYPQSQEIQAVSPLPRAPVKHEPYAFRDNNFLESSKSVPTQKLNVQDSEVTTLQSLNSRGVGFGHEKVGSQKTIQQILKNGDFLHSSDRKQAEGPSQEPQLFQKQKFDLKFDNGVQDCSGQIFQKNGNICQDRLSMSDLVKKTAMRGEQDFQRGSLKAENLLSGIKYTNAYHAAEPLSLPGHPQNLPFSAVCGNDKRNESSKLSVDGKIPKKKRGRPTRPSGVANPLLGNKKPSPLKHKLDPYQTIPQSSTQNRVQYQVNGNNVKAEDVKVSPDLVERLTNNLVEVADCTCLGPDHVPSESTEGPYYTQLGAAKDIPGIRKILEHRTGVAGSAIRIEKVIFTGKEGKSKEGCPVAKWIIRRSGPLEKYLCIVRKRPGHFCNTAVIIVVIVAWEGVVRQQADDLYDFLINTLPKSGFETDRRCGLNEKKTCACQGVDLLRRGASFSFGCSWSMYYNGCKFARSQSARKFKLKEASLEDGLDQRLQTLATDVAPLYSQLVPDAFRNQTQFESRASDCRLGYKPGRPFSGVTAVVDFCCHSHRDGHNMNNGGTVVVNLTKHRGPGKADDEQFHVLPLYILDQTDEFGSMGAQMNKVQAGSLEVLSQYKTQIRFRSAPYRPCKRNRTLGKKEKTPKKMKIGKSKSFPLEKATDQKMGSTCNGTHPYHHDVSPPKKQYQNNDVEPLMRSGDQERMSWPELMSQQGTPGFNELYTSFWDYFYTNGVFPPKTWVSSSPVSLQRPPAGKRQPSFSNSTSTSSSAAGPSWVVHQPSVADQMYLQQQWQQNQINQRQQQMGGLDQMNSPPSETPQHAPSLSSSLASQPHSGLSPRPMASLRTSLSSASVSTSNNLPFPAERQHPHQFQSIPNVQNTPNLEASTNKALFRSLSLPSPRPLTPSVHPPPVAKLGMPPISSTPRPVVYHDSVQLPDTANTSLQQDFDHTFTHPERQDFPHTATLPSMLSQPEQDFRGNTLPSMQSLSDQERRPHAQTNNMQLATQHNPGTAGQDLTGADQTALTQNRENYSHVQQRQERSYVGSAHEQKSGGQDNSVTSSHQLNKSPGNNSLSKTASTGRPPPPYCPPNHSQLSSIPQNVSEPVHFGEPLPTYRESVAHTLCSSTGLYRSLSLQEPVKCRETLVQSGSIPEPVSSGDISAHPQQPSRPNTSLGLQSGLSRSSSRASTCSGVPEYQQHADSSLFRHADPDSVRQLCSPSQASISGSSKFLFEDKFTSLPNTNGGRCLSRLSEPCGDGPSSRPASCFSEPGVSEHVHRTKVKTNLIAADLLTGRSCGEINKLLQSAHSQNSIPVSYSSFCTSLSKNENSPSCNEEQGNQSFVKQEPREENFVSQLPQALQQIKIDPLDKKSLHSQAVLPAQMQQTSQQVSGTIFSQGVDCGQKTENITIVHTDGVSRVSECLPLKGEQMFHHEQQPYATPTSTVVTVGGTGVSVHPDGPMFGEKVKVHKSEGFVVPSNVEGPLEPPYKVIDSSVVVSKEINDNREVFEDPAMGGVAIALCHGAVIFEVAKRELHATTALKEPNRYHPKRISLVFYQHKNLNLARHGFEEYEKKTEERKSLAEQAKLIEELEANGFSKGELSQLSSFPSLTKGSFGKVFNFSEAKETVFPLRFPRYLDNSQLEQITPVMFACMYIAFPKYMKEAFPKVSCLPRLTNGYFSSKMSSTLADLRIQENLKNSESKTKPLKFQVDDLEKSGGSYRDLHSAWDPNAVEGFSPTTNTIVTRWVHQDTSVTGPYNQWIELLNLSDENSEEAEAMKDAVLREATEADLKEKMLESVLEMDDHLSSGKVDFQIGDITPSLPQAADFSSDEDIKFLEFVAQRENLQPSYGKLGSSNTSSGHVHGFPEGNMEFSALVTRRGDTQSSKDGQGQSNLSSLGQVHSSQVSSPWPTSLPGHTVVSVCPTTSNVAVDLNGLEKFHCNNSQPLRSDVLSEMTKDCSFTTKMTHENSLALRYSVNERTQGVQYPSNAQLSHADINDGVMHKSETEPGLDHASISRAGRNEGFPSPSGNGTNQVVMSRRQSMYEFLVSGFKEQRLPKPHTVNLSLIPDPVDLDQSMCVGPSGSAAKKAESTVRVGQVADLTDGNGKVLTSSEPGLDPNELSLKAECE